MTDLPESSPSDGWFIGGETPTRDDFAFEIEPVRTFPAWHYAMLNDRERTRAIEGAIRALDLTGKTVFEIGTGSGIIAMLFARHGARHVYTCELNPLMARLAGRIIAANGLSDRITLLRGASSDLLPDLPFDQPPDVIFSETLDCGVIGEGFWSISRDIQAVAGPDTLVLPSRIVQHGILVEAPVIRDHNHVDRICDFELSALNGFSTHTYFPVYTELLPARSLSAATAVRHYDYAVSTESLPVPVEVSSAGTIHGVLSWMEIDFGGHRISTQPGSGSHWHQAFHPFKQPIDTQPGQRFELTIDDQGEARLEEH